MQIQSSDIETLSALNKRFIHNFVTNDVTSQDAILHPSFRAIYSQGNHIDRASCLTRPDQQDDSAARTRRRGQGAA
ncbi:MAG: hypothetical protein ACK5JG_11975 [Pseudomonadota bacterium]